MYGLNLAADGRILSICVVNEFTPKDMIRVDAMPDGDYNDYRYVGGQYVYDPLPEPEPVKPEPTQMDLIEAQVTYTAVQTGTLINQPTQPVKEEAENV